MKLEEVKYEKEWTECMIRELLNKFICETGTSPSKITMVLESSWYEQPSPRKVERVVLEVKI